MEIRWTRTFDAGHRIWQHNEKCRFLHGHSYRVSIVARGSLNAWGMVVDFGDLKKIIVDRFDHKVILFKGDPWCPTSWREGRRWFFSTGTPPRRTWPWPAPLWS